MGVQDRYGQVAESHEGVFIPTEDASECQDYESQISNQYHDPTACNVLAVHSVVFEVIHRCLPSQVSMCVYLFTSIQTRMWVFPQMGHLFGELFTKSADWYQRNVS
jgi:hypothetical protein